MKPYIGHMSVERTECGGGKTWNDEIFDQLSLRHPEPPNEPGKVKRGEQSLMGSRNGEQEWGGGCIKVGRRLLKEDEDEDGNSQLQQGGHQGRCFSLRLLRDECPQG